MRNVCWTIPSIFYCLLFLQVSGFDCPYKECFCEGRTVFCVNRGFNATPEIVSSNTAGLTWLMFDTNNIKDIPAGHLPANLTEISFDYNPVESIDDNAFIGSADTLELLSFWGAKFSKLPDALTHLKALKYLSIYDSNVIDWNVNVMKEIGLTLESLFLRNAGVVLSPSWIQYLSGIQELNLESCLVTSLPDNSLDTADGNITIISLFNNSLTEVPKAISNLPALKKLNLGNNKISSITWLPRSQLTSLILDHNNISDGQFLSNVLRSSSDSLRTLTLQVNQLTAIPELDFLSNLKKVDLSYNRIADPNLGSFPVDMFEVNLEHNLLPFIPKALSNLTRLIELEMISNMVRQITAEDFPPGVIWVFLGHNLITELEDTTFPVNSTIQYLHLNNNPINHISNKAFHNFPKLTLVNLAETKITRLPLALASVSTLIVFDATNCTELVCTCEEKSLAPVLTPVLSGDVHGNCGDTSIYEFFANYSSAC
ncbi:unnamed protein product [Candidula unifasciata]|uniref:Uncharacterized protein n=1 Tax=Candidula unifasciata TaxID=100452 RepID=A0A8S3ZCK3_9EUPU|nr:unnamed protein product [Candidula unifasciata]